MRTIVTIYILLFLFSTLGGQTLPDSIKKSFEYLSGKEKVDSLTELCWQLREKNTNTALEYGLYAIELADSLGLREEYGQVNDYVGVIYLHYKYNSDKAIPCFHKSFEVALQYNDSASIGYAYNNLGDAYYLTGNAPLASDYAQRSLNYFTALNDSMGIAYAEINFGLVFRLEKMYDRAIVHFKKAISIRERINNKLGIASAYYEIGLAYYGKHDYDTALKYFEEAYRLNAEINNKRWMAFSLDGIGSVLYEHGRYTEALDKFDESLKLNEERDHVFGIIDNKIGKALVYSKIGQKDIGEKEILEALKLARELNVPTKLLRTLEAYHRFYLNLNDYAEADKSFDKFLSVYDSLFSRQQFETLAELQENFSIRQKLAVVKNDLDETRSEVEYSIIIIFLLVVIACILLWRYYSKRTLTRKLTDLNESKDKLFSIIAHDMRNPFSALMLNIELQKDETLSQEERLELVNDLDVVTKNTYSILENLLNLSSARIGKIEFSPTKFDIKELIEELVKSIEPQFRKKSIKIISTIEDDIIFADINMIEVVLRNIIVNAVKFSDEGGIIELHSDRNGSYYDISVKDYGSGIEDDIKKKLFTSEVVRSTPGTAGEKGTGLGLSLSKEFIDKHHGKIIVESELGEGSVFIIKLPQ